ncbi:MAG: DNA polymerase III subunit delta [Sinobacteraceae bacterium]|nr:DNA polymerase III subunit delta [Nevskiaceae bacterium]
MRLTPDKFAAAVKRELAPCYLLAGDEPLLVEENLVVLRAAAQARVYSERETLHAGKDFNWNQLADACATGSLFASRRIVEVRLEAKPDAAAGRLLKALAEKPMEDVLLIVVAGSLDARARKSAWYAQFERSGAACYAWPMDSHAFPAWLGARARAAGLQVDTQALSLLARQTEGNLLAAAQEITKLKLLYPDGQVDAQAVLEGVADSAHFGVFDWIDRLFAGERTAAVRGLANLRQTGHALPALVPALASNLRQLTVVAQTGADASAMKSAGVFARRQTLFRKILGRTRPRQIQGWIRRLSEIDALSKSGGEMEAWREMQALALAIAGVRGPLARTALGGRHAVV